MGSEEKGVTVVLKWFLLPRSTRTLPTRQVLRVRVEEVEGCGNEHEQREGPYGQKV